MRFRCGDQERRDGCTRAGQHERGAARRIGHAPVIAARVRAGALASMLVACTSGAVADAGASGDVASDLGATPDAVALDAPKTLDAAARDGGAMDATSAEDVTADAGRRDGAGMRRDAAADGTAADGTTAVPVDVFVDPAFSAPELLARPTDRSVTVHAVPRASTELFYEYGTTPGGYTARTAPRTVAAGQPAVTVIEPLSPDTRYYYRMRLRRPGEPEFAARAEHSFVTRRPRGATFSFTVQADSHLDDRSDFSVYRSALDNVLRDRPDFHIDLGDTFMCEKHTTPFMAANLAAMDRATVDARYAFDRAVFARITHSVPLFLVNGNHEGESGWLLNNTPNNLAVWATLARKQLFPNPEADAFYDATTDEEPFVGRRQASYAFEWGDALFVTLDPFWYTRERSNTDRWRWTLGEAQYRWLRRVLEGSTARYKFIFVHHLLSGVNTEMRGGVEAAPFFEWGGLNEDRTPGFAARRPGWGAPIHQVLRDTRVTAVFHGHDHVYVHQELDGVVYQEVPQPSASNFTNGAVIAAEGGYASGTVVASSGHLRVTVAPAGVTVDYVRATPPVGTRVPDGGFAGVSYTIPPR